MAERHNWAIYDQVTGKVDWVGVIVVPVVFGAVALAVVALVFAACFGWL